MVAQNEARRFYIERLIVSALALVMIIPFDSTNIIPLFMPIGIAHGFLAILYMWRAGKYKNNRYITVTCNIILLASFIFGLFFPMPFIILVAFLLSFHNFFDDLLLADCQPNWRFVALLLLLVTFVGMVIYDAFYHGSLMLRYIPLLVVLVIGAFTLLIGQRNTAEYPLLVYLAFLFLGFVIGKIFFSANEHIAGFIALTHYFNWYIYLYKKKKAQAPSHHNPTPLKSYMRDTVVMNVVVIGFYAVGLMVWGVPYISLDQSPLQYVHTLFFHPISFWAWTMYHMASTLRPTEYRAAVQSVKSAFAVH